MERIVAIKKLGKILGKSFGYRVDPKAPSREERELAQQRLPALRIVKQLAEEKMNARRLALLEGDQEYQTLKAAWQEATAKAKETASLTMHFKITVGITSSMFFHVRAQGDSWEDVIEKLSREKEKV